MVKKFLVGIVIFILLINSCIPSSLALEISSAELIKIGDADYHLKYYNSDKGYHTYIICSIVGYNNNGKFYPAYCMNSNLPGAENGSYTVNISEMINNDAIWRVVTNGYPYLNASQMGLDNDFDAYVVTKMAIYCILGQSNIDDFSYDEGYYTGHRMYDLLKFLVTVGQTGIDTKQTGTLSVNKSGNLIETGNYYYQEYSVTSRINMKSYTVSDISNFPNGTAIVNTQNNAQNVFNSGDNFRVLIPKSGFNSDINGTINLVSNVENYPVFYGEAPNGFQNCVITYDTYGEENTSINLNIPVNTGRLKILKVDDETKVPISGVEFLLTKKDSQEKYRVTTNEKGEAIFNNLFQGKYTLLEVKTGNSYILDSNSIDINIEYNKILDITVNNTIKRGQVKVIKKDADSGESLSNVTFEILNADTKEVIENLVTNENGEAISSKLRVDRKYILRENWKDDCYKINSKEYPFSVQEDSVIEINVENEKIKGKFKIIKLDNENNEIKLSGVKFELYDENMNLLEELETDENGEVISKEYPSVGTKYYLKESQTLDKYLNNEDLIEIELKNDEVIEVIVTNEKIKGKIKIIKTDEEDKNKKLSGVKFELYDEEMNLLEELETNENGEVESKEYPSVGVKYYLKEIQTLNEYKNNDNIMEIELLNNDCKEIIITNKKIKGKIRVIKIDGEDKNKRLSGVEFELYDKDMNLLEKLKTNENGEVESKEYPSVGNKYYLKEVKTLDEYKKNDELIEIELIDDNVIEVIVENKKIKGSIKIIKSDLKNDKIRLPDVKFELYDENMNLLEELKTNKDGEAISKEYPSVNKTYYLKEIETIHGYYLNPELIELNLLDNKVLEVPVKNKAVEILPIPKVREELIEQVSIVKKLPKTGF